MRNKKLTALIIISIIATNLVACNTVVKTEKEINTETPYYSVTIGSYEKSHNTYMNLDIEVPKITYSNDSASLLIDPLNAEIEESLNKLIDEAKTTALSTYESYIESAKSNAKKEIETKINNLKEKYKNILGEEEVKLISEFTIDDLERMPFDRKFIASDSDFKKFPPSKFRGNFDGKDNSNRSKHDIATTSDGIVYGFTNTSNIIDPNLHNKNIIIVETTAKDISETTISIEGKPGNIETSESDSSKSDWTKPINKGSRSDANKMPPDDFRKDKRNEDKKTFDSNNTKINEDKQTKDINNNFDIDKKNNFATMSELRKDDILSTNSNILNDKNEKVTIGLIQDDIIESHIDEEITLDNFYRDFRRIYMSRIPDDYALAMYYIPTTIKCNFEVKCLDKDYLSLFVEIKESRTTTMIKRLFYNVNLSEGKIMNIKDFLGENYKENVTKIINTEIDKWSEEQKSTLINNYSVDNYISDNTPFFINNNHRAVIQIEKFAITIGSAGYHEFQIP